ASISNHGSGFDVLGLAIEKPGDVVVAARRPEPGLGFSVRAADDEVPVEISRNVAAHVAQLMLDEYRPSFGVSMVLHKRMPVGSGLGSSAASSVAAVVAVNSLLSGRMQKAELLRFAIEGERMVTGAAHADNVAPSLLGGACLVRSYDPLDVISLPVRNTVHWVVIHPQMVVRTADARRVLPLQVSLTDATRQWGNVSGLTVGLARGDAALIGKCVEDVIVEPARAHLIPGFHDIKKAALEAGATGCSISGSGPSVFAVAASHAIARRVVTAMRTACERSSGVQCDSFISRINMKGAVLMRGGGR
ncbi:MAG: homoserine kinase, partial [Ignavibacteria bacterium]|nr:homoserine kinase [Ignavibacteria bacterium]